ncbi:hypothetical protein V6Z11_A05G415500 [Gossypium hirsutum]
MVDLDDRKSTFRYLFHIGFATFSRSSKEKQTIALSTFKVEYIGACQTIWLKNILNELSLTQKDSITIYVDNKSTLSLTKNLVFYSRNKHINIK